MKIKTILIISLVCTFFLSSAFAGRDCPKLLTPPINSAILQEGIASSISRVQEFAHIQRIADEMGIEVWLFGGTASSFVHYVHSDLMGLGGHFDYDFTNIYRSTQDIDLAVDGSPKAAKTFQENIAREFPHFLGSKARWEVRPLRERTGTPGNFGFKEALLEDFDFSHQNTDSHSIGMVSLKSGKISDVKSWNKSESLFLKDVLEGKIHFLQGPHHFETARAKIGENPEILSVLRLLAKAFQYEVQLVDEDGVIQKIIQKFNPRDIANNVARRKIEEAGKKLVIHASDLEYAFDTLTRLGLDKKLISMGEVQETGSMAWWINRKPFAF